MATYGYECPKCGVAIDIYKHIKDRKRKEKCPSCGAMMKRTISSPPFHLKGSGWYTTDYKNKSTPKKNKDE